ENRPTFFTDPSGLRVRVCCNKIPPLAVVSRALWAMPPFGVPLPVPRHCFFDFGGTNNLALHTAGEHGRGLFSSLLLAPIGIVEYGNPFDVPDSGKQCGPWANDCAERCVRKAAAAYPNPSRYLV